MAPVICTMSISVDGYGSGPGPTQTEERPFGDMPGGEPLHRWMFETPDESPDEIAAILGAGAYIMGRRMFGPVRGEWSGDWRGWWGPNPPYHAPVFVLTHHPRESIEMDGGTTFHFVTDGVHAALEQARAVADDRAVHVAGGPSTANQFLAAGLVDELRLQIVPILLGKGERLFDGVPPLELETVSVRPVALATHAHYRVRR
jgi:dihydrofolate reductase